MLYSLLLTVMPALIAAFILFLIAKTLLNLLEYVARILLVLLVSALSGIVGGYLAVLASSSIPPLNSEIAGRLSGITIGLLVGTLVLLTGFKTARRDQGEPQIDAHAFELEIKPSAAVKCEPPVDEPGDPVALPEKDSQVRNAWEQILLWFPRHSHRIMSARVDCARLLKLAADKTNDLDPQMIDRAVLVRRQVPALTSRIVPLWEDGDGARRDQIGERLLASLESLATVSRGEANRYYSRLEGELDIVHAHIANRTGIQDNL